jgi:hypothetical protein
VLGPTRSVRLPSALDAWFVERLDRHRERSASEVLTQLVHGGLRLREGYMAIHRRVLERHAIAGDASTYGLYLQCLDDTFGSAYVRHLENWLVAERIAIPTRDPAV